MSLPLLTYYFFFPNYCCSIRLTTYDFVKRLIATSEKELQKIMEENRDKQHQSEKELKKIVEETDNTKVPVVK